MKKIFISILGLVIIFVISGCSGNKETQFRIRNEQLDKASVTIQPSGGNKISIYDVEPGQTTEYKNISEGNITVTDVSHNESVSFIAVKNTQYTIIFSTGKPPSVNEDQ
jgi:hypothetical protein